MLATLRSARSYYVADTALQIAGDSGFLNYSLTPVERPEEILPPQAVIKTVPQAQAGQVVVFDGSASTGQVPLVAWSWDFGDGTSASGVIVQHGYLNPGAYNVQLTVTDQRAQTGTNAQQILILPPPGPTVAPTLPPPPPTSHPRRQPSFTRLLRKLAARVMATWARRSSSTPRIPVPAAAQSSPIAGASATARSSRPPPIR